MDDQPTTIALCSCEDTMRPDAKAVRRACPEAAVKSARQLCRGEAGLFGDWARNQGRLIVGCTQEAPLFQELAQENGFSASLTFANIRETAGWSAQGDAAGPKMAALLAAAQVEAAPVAAVTLRSEGVALILGGGQAAVDLAAKLADRLDVTVMLDRLDGVTPPRRAEFPIRRGRARQAKGWLGAFEVVIDGYGEPAPSSKSEWLIARGGEGLISRCDILIDLSGGRPLFPAHELRAGYLRADPALPASVAELAFQAADLVGDFDKPRYIDFKPELCAHSRSRITGCTRCLDLCPTGAIEPAGDHVAISPEICAGCGACAAACPTGAADYALPKPDALLATLRRLLTGYRAAGGRDAVVLFHDAGHGWGLIDALARYGQGLPANVLPVEVNETTQVGVEALAAVFAYGGAAVRFLVRARPKHDTEGLRRVVALGSQLIGAQGYGGVPAAMIETDDPDEFGAQLATIAVGHPALAPSSFQAAGGKRQVMTVALREMHRVAPQPVDIVALEKGAPFGRIVVDTEGCTLCLACVSACPVSALGDNPDRPMLTFDESLCVQCGLCAATCPEKVIALEPRASFKAFGEKPVVIKQEEPAHCLDCGKAFGVRSTIDRVAAKLEDRHWMFAGANAERLRVLRLCEDCRVGAMAAQKFDPYGMPERAPARTTEDYLKEREGKS